MCRFLFSLGLFCSLVSFGCGQKSVANLDTSGKVTYKGAPAQYVTVTLTDAQGNAFSGTTDEQGQFLIAAVTPGDKTVTVTAKQVVDPTAVFTGSGPKADKNTKPGMKGGGGMPAIDQKSKDAMKEKLASKDSDAKLPTPPQPTKIPAKYSDLAKSGLTWSVAPATLKKDFDLND